MDDAQKENERQALREAQAESRRENAPEDKGFSGRQWAVFIGLVVLIVAGFYFALPCAGFRFKVYKGGASAIEVIRLTCKSTQGACSCYWQGDIEGQFKMCAVGRSDTRLVCSDPIIGEGDF